MKCRNCGKAKKIASVSAKCSDMCSWQYGRAHRDGYVPSNMGIGNEYGDYVVFDYCVHCGTIQNTQGNEFPVKRLMSRKEREAC